MDGVDADIMTFAKGIGSGFPMAGVATRETTFDGIAAGQLVGFSSSLPFFLADVRQSRETSPFPTSCFPGQCEAEPCDFEAACLS